MILKNYQKVNNVLFAEKANRFLYWLGDVPLLKKVFHSDWVKEYTSKEGIALLIQSLSLLKRLVYKTIYILIIALVVAANTPVTFNIVFVSLSIIGSIMHSIIKMDANDYNMVVLLRMNPHEYAMSTINHYLLEEGILFLLAFFMISFALPLPLLSNCYTLLIYLCVHIIGEAITIRTTVNNNYKEPEGNWKRFTRNGIICLLLVLFVFLVLHFNLQIPMYVLLAVEFPCICLGLYSYRWLNTIPDFNKYFRYNLTIEKINQLEQLATTSEAKEQHESFNRSIKLTDKKSSKIGYDFVFETFLNRYGTIFSRRNIIILVIILVLGVSGDVAPFIFDIDRVKIAEGIFNHLYLLFAIIYFFSGNSKVFVMACFLEIDRYLVNYHFFRRSQDVIKNFRLRLYRVIQITMLPSATTALVLCFLFVLHGGNTIRISQLAVIFILPLVLALFYSVYYLAAYYLFQPYNYEGVIVNKTYSIVTSIIYAINYVLLQVDELVITVPALIVIIVVLAILSAVLYFAVYKFAPKEFRVR